MAQYGVPEGSSFAFDIGMRSLDAQSRRIDALDNKAAVLLAVDGVLAGFIFDGGARWSEAPKGLILTGVCSLLVSFMLALAAFWTRRYATAPEFTAVAQKMIRGEQWLKWRFLVNLREAEETNGIKLKWKVRLLKWSMGALLADVLALGGYLILSLWRL